MPTPPTAHPTPNEDNPNATTHSPLPPRPPQSLPTRILHSAAALSRSLVANPPPTTLSASLASTNPGKALPPSAAPSSSSSAVAGPSSTWAQQNSSFGARGVGDGERSRQFRGSLGTLRDPLSEEAQELDAFVNLQGHSLQGTSNSVQWTPDTVWDQNDETSGQQWGRDFDESDRRRVAADGLDDNHSYIHFGGDGAQERNKQATSSRTEDENLTYTIPHATRATFTTLDSPSDIQTASSLDGAEVVALLSTPSSLTNPETFQTELDHLSTPSAADLFNDSPPLNPPSQHVQNHAQPERLLPDKTPPSGDEGSLDHWLRAWDSLTANYVDDVWGPEGELREARREVERIREEVGGGDVVGGDGGGDVKREGERERAVERLRMILGHVWERVGGAGGGGGGV